MTRVRLLLLDPERLLRTGHRARLSEEFEVRTPATGAALLAAEPALCLLSDATPLSCAAAVGAGHTVLALTAEHDGPRLLDLLAAGVTGYAQVDEQGDELFVAVAAVAARHAFVPPSMLGGLLHQLVQNERAPTHPPAPRDDDRFDRLSRREREVLELLAAGNDQQGIARELVISPQTARTHIQNVLGKLGVHSRLEAVALAMEFGQLGPGGRNRT